MRAYRGLLTAEETARCNRFALPRGRHECLVTRALVRTLLSQYTGADPRDWRFALGAYGRPEIERPTAFRGLRFNVSHTRGRIVCLLARDIDIGVDVEDSDRRVRFLSIAHRYFSADEAEALRAVPESQRRRRFFDYWTLKESYIKARGMGLALPLGQFSFVWDDSGPVRIIFQAGLADDAAEWQFGKLALTTRHPVAIAVRRGRAPDLRLVVREASRV